jgi:2-C-methyl-D-erythritol 4-phosphate cytidylyltransferase
MSVKNIALIAAAGKSSRVGTDKLFFNITAGHVSLPVVYFSISAFDSNEKIDAIYIVSSRENIGRFEQLSGKYFTKVRLPIIEGANLRQDSVKLGLEGITGNDDDDNVLIHNGSNPLVSQPEINECISCLKTHNAVITYHQMDDSCSFSPGMECVGDIIPRAYVIRHNTPQGFKLGFLKGLYKENTRPVTDEAMLVKISSDCKIALVRSANENIKMTYYHDLRTAEALLKARLI